MEQMHLVCYLESLGCEEVKLNNKGMYIMRNKATGAISAVPVPSNGKTLKESTICSVCKVLGVEIPPITSKEVEEMMHRINKRARMRIDKKN